MTTVCQKCGVRGFSELLIYCRGCKIFAEHLYCLDIIPENWKGKVNLLCEDCSVQGVAVLSFDGYGRKASKKKKKNKVSPSRNDRKVEVNFPSTKTQKLGRPKRRLILSDDDISHDEAQSGGIDRNVLRKNGSDPNTRLMVVASRSTKLAHDQLEERKHLSSQSYGDINVNRWKRRLIHPNADELEEKTPFNCFDKKVPNKGTSSLTQPQGYQNIIVGSKAIVPSEVVSGPQIVSDAATEPQAAAHVESINAHLNMPCHQGDAEQFFYIPARPISHHVWRGYFSICNEEYGPVLAHKSSKACEKVSYGATLLTSVLHMEKVSKLDAWPKSFQISPPTDDNIALYFFPTGEWSEAVLDQLLDDLISKDLMLKVTFDEAELLVYTSVLLPEHYHRFDGKYYLWGVFRTRQVPVSSTLATYGSELDRHTEEKQVPVPGTSAQNQLTEEKQLLVNSTHGRCSAPHPLTVEKLESGGFNHAEMEGVSSHVERSSDVAQDGDASASSHYSDVTPREVPAPSMLTDCWSKLREFFGGKKEMSRLEQSEDKEDGEICDEVLSFDASDSGNENIGEEREEGEICDDMPYSFFGSKVNDDTSSCLELFPLRNEDIAITGKLGRRSGLDLQLGLGSSAGDEGNDSCEGKMKFVSKLYLDSAIY